MSDVNQSRPTEPAILSPIGLAGLLVCSSSSSCGVHPLPIHLPSRPAARQAPADTPIIPSPQHLKMSNPAAGGELLAYWSRLGERGRACLYLTLRTRTDIPTDRQASPTLCRRTNRYRRHSERGRPLAPPPCHCRYPQFDGARPAHHNSLQNHAHSWASSPVPFRTLS
ncbi:hypothetical protein ElyMa_005747300 [Elysia marginata]|uniref:Uncharacterized protein n=1 Tax=Elysia marginata TaxID=1093978 RepID=A0AAV4FLE0_9GAST|nr:hypothetical protein ElyMa_005747300 [Elysia marginata]